MTQRLPPEALGRASAFLAAQARPLERSLWAWASGEGGADAVREKLAAFQHPDGGFGRALEPDIPAAGSSVYATTLALQTQADLDVSADDPLVAGAMGYLAASYDEAQRAWPMMPADLESAPHAPW